MRGVWVGDSSPGAMMATHVSSNTVLSTTVHPSPDWVSCAYGRRVASLVLIWAMVCSVLYQYHAPAWQWVGPLAHCLLLCPLAVLAAKWFPRWVNNTRVSLLSQFLGGAWVVLMGFNVLPSVLLVLTQVLNGLSVGGRHFLRWASLAQILGLLGGLVVFGVHWQLEPSLLIVLASLPLMMFQPWMVTVVAHKTFAQMRSEHDELRYVSQHDGLSGLLNRAHWDIQVRAAFERQRATGQPVVLVMADLDHFKRINDRHGHAAGDEAIRRFAATLKGLLRSSDVCGRYGGEEFGILMTGASEAEAARALESVRQALHLSPLLEAERVTASFGVAALGPGVHSVEAWMRLADQRLYRAKDLGRDRIEAGV